MKAVLVFLGALNLVVAFFAFFAFALGYGAAFAAGALGAALLCAIGYGVLDRLDKIAAGNAAIAQLRQVLVEIRDRLPKPPPILPPPPPPVEPFDPAKAVAAMEVARDLGRRPS